MTTYIVMRRATVDSPPEYYSGDGQWTTKRDEAKAFTGAAASMLCENFQTRYPGFLSFIKQ